MYFERRCRVIEHLGCLFWGGLLILRQNSRAQSVLTARGWVKVNFRPMGNIAYGLDGEKPGWRKT